MGYEVLLGIGNVLLIGCLIALIFALVTRSK